MTDTYFADTPAHDDGIHGRSGAMFAQVYCGRSSQLTAVQYAYRNGNAWLLEDFLRQHGAPRLLFSDNAKVQVSKAVHDILQLYCIDGFSVVGTGLLCGPLYYQTLPLPHP